jgi:hypothetical protein
VQVAWARAKVSHDVLYLDSVALGLHAFYGGVERLLEQIARFVDARIEPLVVSLPVVYDRLETELLTFATLLGGEAQ